MELSKQLLGIVAVDSTGFGQLCQGAGLAGLTLTIHADGIRQHAAAVLSGAVAVAEGYVSGLVQILGGNSFHPSQVLTGLSQLHLHSLGGILFGQDENGGLAFVSAAGLHEGGMDQDGAMSITLLRSFSRAYLVDRPEKCKLLGKHHFRYAMAVMNQKDSYADLLKTQDRLCAEFTARFGRGEAEMGKSLLKLNGEKLQISAVKAPEDGDMNAVIVRLWNASAEKQRGVLESGFALKNVQYVALDETCAVPADFEKYQIPLEIAPWEIVTLRLNCEKE